jgi:hypothetical protein
MVYLSTTGAGAVTTVIKLTKWALDMSTDKIEVTSFLDSNKTYVQGLKDIKGTFAGFFDDTETKPFVASDSTSGCLLYLYPSSLLPSRYWAGPAWLDVSVDTGVADAVAISGNFVANGTWVRF